MLFPEFGQSTETEELGDADVIIGIRGDGGDAEISYVLGDAGISVLGGTDVSVLGAADICILGDADICIRGAAESLGLVKSR